MQHTVLRDKALRTQQGDPQQLRQLARAPPLRSELPGVVRSRLCR